MNVRTRVKKTVRENQDMFPRAIAEEVMIMLFEKDIRECALNYLSNLASEELRARSHDVMSSFAPVQHSQTRSSYASGTAKSTSTTLLQSKPLEEFVALRTQRLMTLIWVNHTTGHVRLGEMTVDHHRSIMLQMTNEISGINNKIASHQRAIEIIERAGVSTLNEVEDQDVLAALGEFN